MLKSGDIVDMHAPGKSSIRQEDLAALNARIDAMDAKLDRLLGGAGEASAPTLPPAPVEQRAAEPVVNEEGDEEFGAESASDDQPAVEVRRRGRPPKIRDV
jgi:hypothetical protein